ncbi:hypothetical protein [Cellulophaga sp. HaHa_2_1]|uniref:hypothetical protein n=1 Tax=Cellulophaga sp. HaHa_2_1 TaxID=2749994 RepID=UPI001C4F2AE9|nr:hypothetical protein [Cellulophaga sp. HaHa_2_1]QXP52948.1 hypothetical protein H0I24_03205 [Cellulophaga sp. HaHa_2_1]
MSPKIIFSLFSILLLVQVANGQDKVDYDQVDTEITNHYKDYKYLSKKRPGYYLQVNNQNCHYEIETNELASAEYYGEFPSYSVRIPLNLQILNSGSQKLSIKMLPFRGDTLTNKANLDLTLLYYPDITDLENNFGGSTTLWKWEMPKLETLKLPYFELDTVFEAEVPYDINVLDDYAEDLSKIDREDLLKEVITEFIIKREKIINRAEDKSYLISHIKRAMIQIYPDDDLLDEVAEDMLTFSKDKEAQPLENFEMRLYYNGRIATLLKRDDKEPAIWFKRNTSGARSWQPYYIFKHKETGTWHMW